MLSCFFLTSCFCPFYLFVSALFPFLLFKISNHNYFELCIAYHEFLSVPPLEWIPLGDGAVSVPAADDGATEVSIPPGFRFGEAIHHTLYVS